MYYQIRIKIDGKQKGRIIGGVQGGGATAGFVRSVAKRRQQIRMDRIRLIVEKWFGDG